MFSGSSVCASALFLDMSMHHLTHSFVCKYIKGKRPAHNLLARAKFPKVVKKSKLRLPQEVESCPRIVNKSDLKDTCLNRKNEQLNFHF